jgi:Domain of unknown function (DUF1707)
MASELDGLGSYRVGDAERGHTLDLLKEAHVAGYLTLAEMDERLSSALAARTRADLERLVADLPPEWRARQEGAQPVAPVPAGPGHVAPRSAPPLLPLAFAAVMVALVVVALVTRGFFFPLPLLWIFLAFGRRHHHYRRGDGGWRPPDSRRITWI